MKYAVLLFAVILIAGCTAAPEITVNESNTPQLVDAELNGVYENEFLASETPFIGAAVNELYDVEVRLTGAGRIKISENNKVDEYFRVDFNVTNHANRDMDFPYEATITEGNFPNVKINQSDEKRPVIGTLRTNETKSGYVLFRNYRAQNKIIELTISGGYRQFSTNRINFRFKIDLGNESGVTLERVTLDFNEEGNTIHPGAFLLIRIPSNNTYRYILSSDRNVSVDIWPPDTKVITIQSSNTTINNTCTARLQRSVTRECQLDKNYIMAIKRVTNAKTQDFEGATVSIYLFKVFPKNDTSGVLKYTGQTTYDVFKDSQGFFVVL